MKMESSRRILNDNNNKHKNKGEGEGDECCGSLLGEKFITLIFSTKMLGTVKTRPNMKSVDKLLNLLETKFFIT